MAINGEHAIAKASVTLALVGKGRAIGRWLQDVIKVALGDVVDTTVDSPLNCSAASITKA